MPDWCPDDETGRHKGLPRSVDRPDRSRQPAGRAPAGQHRRRPGFTVVSSRKVWTRYGWCESEAAQVLAERGVDTESIPMDEGWLTDDEG